MTTPTTLRAHIAGLEAERRQAAGLTARTRIDRDIRRLRAELTAALRVRLGELKEKRL